VPGPPDYDGVCRNCGCDEYVCSCGEADLVPAAEYYRTAREKHETQMAAAKRWVSVPGQSDTGDSR
jgi:hypothetical protein